MDEFKLQNEYESLSQSELIGLLKEAQELIKKKDVEVDNLKTSFLANISHEIRTPMNAIMGFSELLGDVDLSQNDRELFVGFVKESSSNLLKTLDDLIQTARIENKDIKITNSTFDVNYLMDELYENYCQNNEKISNKRVHLKYRKIQEEPQLIESDFSKLKVVLSNLLDNALKFTSYGTVEFGCQSSDHKNILFFVKDTGIGVPINKKNSIFDKFTKVNNDCYLETNGLGLGLTISKHYIKQLGGMMGLKSELGKGSEFYFTLPICKSNYHDDFRVPLVNNFTLNKLNVTS